MDESASKRKLNRDEFVTRLLADHDLRKTEEKAKRKRARAQLLEYLQSKRTAYLHKEHLKHKGD